MKKVNLLKKQKKNEHSGNGHKKHNHFLFANFRVYLKNGKYVSVNHGFNRQAWKGFNETKINGYEDAVKTMAILLAQRFGID